MRIVTPDEMRAFDERAITDLGIPVEVLMERAGEAVAEVAEKMLFVRVAESSSERVPTTKTVLVLCGKGNNGGDGFVVARRLHERGIGVTICLVAGEPKESAVAYAMFSKIPPNIICLSLQQCIEDHCWKKTDLIVDAVFGTGFQGEITGDLAELFHNISATTNRILAVDIPSGIDGLTGDVCGVAVRATKTVTMQCIKKGLLDNDGPRYAGEVIVADIGIPTE